MMHGPEKSDSVIVAGKPTKKRSDPQRSWWSEGQGPRGMRPIKHALDSEPDKRVTRCWFAYGNLLPSIPEVGEAMGRPAEVMASSSSTRTDGGCPVAQVNDLSRSPSAFDPISTLVVVVEMSKARWLVSGAVPGVERQPLKKLEPDATALLRLIERWRGDAWWQADQSDCTGL
jgi:hypothetical protein